MSEIEVGEIWKDIKGYEGLYQVSNLGNIKSLFRYKKILKPTKNTLGYLKVSLYKDKKIKVMSVHRLVAEAFLENTNNFTDINHKDGNKTNNKVENLEWCTRQQNILHRFRVLKQEPFKKYGDINWNDKKDVNRYHNEYYYKHLEEKRKYNREYKRNKYGQNCYKVVK